MVHTLAAQPQGAPPPRQLQLTPAGHAEFVICDYTIEVFFEDWKANEGWANMAKQQGEEGSSRGLILSLLTDHCLFLHPEQTAPIENKLPACTVGSLRNRVKVDALMAFIRDLVCSENPMQTLDQLSGRIKEVFELRPSKKHMVGRDFGRLEPTPSLKYKAAMTG